MKPKSLRSEDKGAAFTLIELLAVIGTVALLAMLLLPALAGTKTDTWRAQCQNQMKQLGAGFGMFEQDHNDMFPPAGLSTGSQAPVSGQMTWDCYIHRYIGGKAPDDLLTSGMEDPTIAPSILRCPTDTQPKVNWVGGGAAPWLALRSYEMIAPGTQYSTYVQVNCANGYILPRGSLMGVGIYWVNASMLDWDAQSYKTSVIKDPSGSILLDEQPGGENIAGNIWPCVSLGPVGTNYWTLLYQTDPTAGPQDTNSSVGANQGAYTYRAHNNHFNYLFYDGHVAALSINETVGTGTLTKPKGMWTLMPGD